MKTFKLSAMLAAATLFAGATSCSEAELSDSARDGQVTFNLQLQPKSTRAGGATFGLGTYATSLKCLVFDKTGKYLTQTSTTLADGQGSVKLNLANSGNYQILFWADAGTDLSPYTLSDNGEISVNLENIKSCSEYNDAFYAVTEYTGGSSDNENVTLTRPFAQINFGTDDTESPRVKETYPSGVYTTVTTDVYTKMNLLTNEVSDKKSYTTQIVPMASIATETFPVVHKTEGKKYDYVNMLYAIVPEEGATTDYTMKVYKSSEATAKLVWTLKVPSAPAKQNWRTNIFGSLNTSDTQFNVIIDNKFEDFTNIQNGKTITVNTDAIDEFQGAIDYANENPNTRILVNCDIKLTENNFFELSGKNTIFEVAEGKTISNEPVTPVALSVRHYTFTITDKASVTFTGKGTIKDRALLIDNKGTLTINDGNFVGTETSTPLYPLINNSGTLTVNGGSISSVGSCIETKNVGSSRVYVTFNSGVLFSSNDYCYKCNATNILTTIHNGLFKSYYGCLSLTNEFEIENGTFLVQKSDKVANAAYTVLMKDIYSGGFRGGSFYSREGDSTVLHTVGDCDLFIDGGRYSKASASETADGIAPSTGFEWFSINEPALPGTNPLTRTVMRPGYYHE